MIRAEQSTVAIAFISHAKILQLSNAVVAVDCRKNTDRRPGGSGDCCRLPFVIILSDRKVVAQTSRGGGARQQAAQKTLRA